VPYGVIIIPSFFVAVCLIVSGSNINRKLKLTQYSYTNKKLPASFDGYKILHISDLHGLFFGGNQSEIHSLIKKNRPDMIVLTGDIIDKDNRDIGAVKALVSNTGKIAPIYFVAGNHELHGKASFMYKQLLILFERHGVHVLHDKCVPVRGRTGNDRIYLYGCPYQKHVNIAHAPDTEAFNILLFHDSTQFDKIADAGFDMVFSGHSHGGIIRLPLIGGLIGNDQKLLPAYDGGMFPKGGCTLVSSRGLGGSILPRINNPPEIILLTLRSGTSTL